MEIRAKKLRAGSMVLLMKSEINVCLGTLVSFLASRLKMFSQLLTLITPQQVLITRSPKVPRAVLTSVTNQCKQKSLICNLTEELLKIKTLLPAEII